MGTVGVGDRERGGSKMLEKSGVTKDSGGVNILEKQSRMAREDMRPS